MILHAVAERGDPTQPWLVFLHGFSGDHREWRPVGERFTRANRLYIDLPGHGSSANVQVDGFADLDALLKATLLSYNILNYWLVGYSLGGRVAMHFACRSRADGLAGVIVEGGHPGLIDDAERAQRWRNDRQIISNNKANQYSPVVTAVAMSTKTWKKKYLPTHCPIPAPLSLPPFS